MAPMAMLGLLGGSSWESTSLYYKYINETVRKRIGGFHSAPLVMHSVDFAEMHAFAEKKQWTESAKVWGAAAKGLVSSGAQAVMLCCNSFHIVAADIKQASGVPFIHIVDATGEKIKAAGLRKVVLLGTKPTMEHTYFQEGLAKYGVEAVVPEQPDLNEVGRVIYEELVHGIVKDSSRATYVKIVRKLAEKEGAQGLVMGCTEIGMLLNEQDLQDIPLFDTLKIHVEKAVDWAIQNAPAKAA